MKPNIQLTSQIEELAKEYNFYARFEKDYAKVREIEANNYNIIVHLKKLGVKNLYSE